MTTRRRGLRGRPRRWTGAARRPPLLFVHSTLPHAVWRLLPDGRGYPIEGVENLGLSSKGWVGPQWQVDQGFQRHVLQVQYTDRLVGGLLDKLRARGLYDDAVIVLAADHGASFLKGTPRRPVSRENVGAIAPVPFFVKLPGQHEARVDDSAVRTIDVLPTIAKAAGVELPWKVDGIPADERAVDPAAPIDVSHGGEPVLTESLGAVLAQESERERAEAQLLRDGVYAMGPRPELLGRHVEVRAGGRQVTFDDAAAVVPSFISGRPGSWRPKRSSRWRSTGAWRRPHAFTAMKVARASPPWSRPRRCATGRTRSPCCGCSPAASCGRSAESAERGALGLVAGRAEDLQVLDGSRSSHRDRDHVVVLDLEARSALHAASAVALEHGQADRARIGRRRGSAASPASAAWARSSVRRARRSRWRTSASTSSPASPSSSQRIRCSKAQYVRPARVNSATGRTSCSSWIAAKARRRQVTVAAVRPSSSR